MFASIPWTADASSKNESARHLKATAAAATTDFGTAAEDADTNRRKLIGEGSVSVVTYEEEARGALHADQSSLSAMTARGLIHTDSGRSNDTLTSSTTMAMIGHTTCTDVVAVAGGGTIGFERRHQGPVCQDTNEGLKGTLVVLNNDSKGENHIEMLQRSVPQSAHSASQSALSNAPLLSASRPSMSGTGGVVAGVAQPSSHSPSSGERFLSMSRSSILSTVWHRISILISLLLLQSLSQFILERYEGLLSDHVIVPLFLTMLVGAGGNAGNQSAVRSITGLVSGEFKTGDYFRVIRKEITVGLINSIIVATIGFSRVYYFYGHRDLFWSTIAITASLFCIVFASVVLGTSLPFVLGRFNYDKEHAAPIIQVVMDITGVLITCLICNAIIPDSEHTTKAAGSIGGV